MQSTFNTDECSLKTIWLTNHLSVPGLFHLDMKMVIYNWISCRSISTSLAYSGKWENYSLVEALAWFFACTLQLSFSNLWWFSGSTRVLWNQGMSMRLCIPLNLYPLSDHDPVHARFRKRLIPGFLQEAALWNLCRLEHHIAYAVKWI